MKHPTLADIVALTARVWRKRNPEMTTDPEEGVRQIEAMKPEPLKVGDKVRLMAAGPGAGRYVLKVVALEDYGNNAVCEWEDGRETFPVRSLVRVEPDNKTG